MRPAGSLLKKTSASKEKKTMNPEMKAKVEEIMKASRIRELDADSMAGVSGGAEMTIHAMGADLTREEFDKMMFGTLNALGSELTMQLFTDLTGQKTGLWKGVQSISSERGITPEEKLRMELDWYWKKRAMS